MRWATDGNRLEIPVVVEFCPGGELRVLRSGDFLGEWVEPPGSAWGPLQVLSAPGDDGMPRPGAQLVTPGMSGGSWRMTDAEQGRMVEFNLETTGFHRQSIWLPRSKLWFKAKAYGATLAAGLRPPCTIRESLISLGVVVAFLLGLALGPAGWLSIVYFAFGVSICVGTWTSSRVAGEPGDESVPPVTLRQDVPELWR
ncbi:unnamed protein product [Prorocentrum cordatum]|uniref:Uncharacterized protein n=1 Tax=Prorocentrum cordatum TaxID=2364126 RepID=A0ABN9QQY7_9DINO|nr:unnamed protein product [Polarella glacialis]